MSAEPRRAPKRSRVFWVFLPIVVLLVFSLVISFESMPPAGKVVAVGVGAMGVLLLLATYDAARFGWAIRLLGAAVFAGYTLYLVSEIQAGHAFRLDEPRSVASPKNALLGLVLFGLPGLFIALRPTRGRSLLEIMASARGPRRDDDGDA
jgi:hypothetical protein